jgi:hypothetical protein
MSHVECPSFGIRFPALAAPSICPDCLARGRGRFGLVPSSILDSPPRHLPARGPSATMRPFALAETDD